MRFGLDISHDLPDSRRTREPAPRPREASSQAPSIPSMQPSPTPLEIWPEVLRARAAVIRMPDIPGPTREGVPKHELPEREKEISPERSRDIERRIGRDVRDAGRILSSILPRLAPDTLATRECPRGVDHFLAYLEARQVFEEGYVSPTLEQARTLAEGDSIYATATHDEIFEAWIEGNLTLEQIRARYAEKPGKISIRGYLIRADFPYNGPKYRGVA
jgi:hypothetical protein